MNDIQSMIVRLRNPSGRPGDLGTVEYAFYRVGDGVQIMTNQEGHPIRKNNGEIFSWKLGPDDNPRVIAARLTKEIRRELYGDSDFYKPINYPPRAVV